MPLVFDRTRHFTLLAAFALAVAIAGPRPGAGIALDFALFGTLHATALALSIGAAVSRFRRLAFVALAGALAGLTAKMALLAGQIAGSAGWPVAPLGVLAVGAGFGALVYAAWVRLALTAVLSPGGSSMAAWLGATVLGCAAAASGGFILARSLNQTGFIWVVAPWWFAFSGSLIRWGA